MENSARKAVGTRTARRTSGDGRLHRSSYVYSRSRLPGSSVARVGPRREKRQAMLHGAYKLYRLAIFYLTYSQFLLALGTTTRGGLNYVSTLALVFSPSTSYFPRT